MRARRAVRAESLTMNTRLDEPWWPLIDATTGITILEQKIGDTGYSLREFVNAANIKGEGMKPPQDIPYSSLKAVLDSGKSFSKLRFSVLAETLKCLLTDIASDKEQLKPEKRQLKQTAESQSTGKSVNPPAAQDRLVQIKFLAHVTKDAWKAHVQERFTALAEVLDPSDFAKYSIRQVICRDC
jgi:hypothetical protein